jgi:hypothetical protein
MGIARRTGLYLSTVDVSNWEIVMESINAGLQKNKTKTRLRIAKLSNIRGK